MTIRCLKLLQGADMSELAYSARLERKLVGEATYTRIMDFDFLSGNEG